MAAGITPGRRTYAEFNGLQRIQIRPAWALWRWASQMGGGVSAKTEKAHAIPANLRPGLLPGDAWSLNPLEGEIVRGLFSDYADAIIPPSGFTLAPNMQGVSLFQTSDIPGMGQPASLFAGPSAIRKRVPTGQHFDHPDNRLVADEATFAKLPEAFPPLNPVDRVALSTEAYKANSGFFLSFETARSYWPSDILLEFFWGGPVDTDPGPADDPTTQNAGIFGLQVRASGWAVLYELTGPANLTTSWTKRLRFQWAESARVTAGHQVIGIMPHGRDRMLFISRQTDQGMSPSAFTIIKASIQSRQINFSQSYYRATLIETGRTYLKSMTGVGPIRLSLGREMQRPITVLRMKFPATSNLLDGPFEFEKEMPAGTVMNLLYDTFVLGDDGSGGDFSSIGGSVTGEIYDADTDLVCLPGPDPGQFLSVAKQTKYYVRTDFTADDSQFTTPLMFGARVTTDGVADDIGSTPITGGILQSFDGTGPDLDPEHETYSLNIADIKNELTYLQKHDRTYTRIKVATTDDPRGFVVIGEGETSPSDSQRRGYQHREGFGAGSSDSLIYPDEAWQMWERLKILGHWRRLASKICEESMDFNFDPTAPPDPHGGRPPWKVTGVIQRLLLQAGVPGDEIDIPDNDLRLWQGSGLPKDAYLVQPGVKLFPLAVFLAVHFMGQPLIRDYNVGPDDRGMYRLLPNPPGPPYDDPPGSANILAEFFLKRPVDTIGKLATAPLAYGGPASTWIRKRSYCEKHYAPEFNDLVVTATGEVMASDKTAPKLVKHLPNPKSYNIDPAHPTADPNSPDWLGFREPVRVYDPLLQTEEAVDFWATRLFLFAGHAEDWAFWQSPFIFVNDPLDTLLNASGPRLRPLRINDLITINKTGVPGEGRLAIVRSCNPGWKRDRLQLANYEAKFLEPETP